MFNLFGNNKDDYPIDLSKSFDDMSYKDLIDSITPVLFIDNMIESYIGKNREKYKGKEVAYDLLIENQRGFIFFGLPVFTKYLFPFDPPHFTNLYGEEISNLKLFPIPDLNWKWSWDKWLVSMDDKDTDDQGWKYSWRFDSSHWTGEQNFGFCVRRRIWIRLRERNSDLS